MSGDARKQWLRPWRTQRAGAEAASIIHSTFTTSCLRGHQSGPAEHVHAWPCRRGVSYLPMRMSRHRWAVSVPLGSHHCLDDPVSVPLAARAESQQPGDLLSSRDSSGNYSCGYEIKDSNNRVSKSQLSPAKHLSVTWLDLKLLLGIIIPAILVLAVVLYLLGKKGNVSTPLITLSNCLSAMSLPRNQRSVHGVAVAFSRLLGRPRQQGRPERVQRDTSNPYEEDIHYASVDWLGSSRQPLPQREETPTYADINLQRDRCH
ncbi:uncharacterized protein LOC120388669 [Mauremys reevesii]|uniref:uncharacterized protein LOC120388669 n=1 Tax=Mauremys reevesii TaxID=260615 RepID=UPI00193FEBAD|nr:uncharacterized protein LOC120388669 [Mauremys reevesii]